MQSIFEKNKEAIKQCIWLWIASLTSGCCLNVLIMSAPFWPEAFTRYPKSTGFLMNAAWRLPLKSDWYSSILSLLVKNYFVNYSITLKETISEFISDLASSSFVGVRFKVAILFLPPPRVSIKAHPWLDKLLLILIVECYVDLVYILPFFVFFAHTVSVLAVWINTSHMTCTTCAEDVGLHAREMQCD